MMAPDKGRYILFAFQLKKSAVEVAKMIPNAFGEDAVIHT